MNRVKKPIGKMIFAVATLMMIASCASPPPATETPTEPTPPAPVVQEKAPPPAPAAPAISQEELDKLLAEAQSLKKKAFDLKLFEVLPDEYASAEELYKKGLASYEAKEAEAAKEGLGKAIASYGDLISKGVVALAAARRKTAEDMRDAAAEAGADEKAAERFDPASQALDSGIALADASKNEEAIAAFESARLYFELAEKRARAGDMRTRIQGEDFAFWDSANYQIAENKYAAEEGLWATGSETDRAAGVDALDAAILSYKQVVQKGREGATVAVREKTDQAKTRSEEIKAHVAVKALYATAVSLYDEASTKFLSGDFEEAQALFESASEAFEAAYESAAEKRANAETAMQAASEAQAESGRVAEDGDALISQSENL